MLKQVFHDKVLFSWAYIADTSQVLPLNDINRPRSIRYEILQGVMEDFSSLTLLDNSQNWREQYL
jgi:hypothetical protein